MNLKSTKQLAAFMLGISMAVTPLAVANATESSPTSGTSTSATTGKIAKKDRAAIDAYKVAKTEYQTALTAFKAAKQAFKEQKAAQDALKPALSAYAEAKKVIGQTFASSVAAAEATYKQAISGTPTAEQKLAAKTAFESAKTAASAARAAAITALGAAPAKPAELTKPTKPVKPSRP
jgi:septal ring factor EnvC (AmiA/AmiB activator)